MSSISHCAAAAAGRFEHQQRRALPDEEHRERHHDVGNARDHDQRAVDRAEQQVRGASTSGTTRRRELLARAVHQDCGGDAGQRHHRGDREVDAAGDDHDGLRRDREGEGQRGADERAEAGRAVVGLDELGDDEQQRRAARTGRAPSPRGGRPHHGARIGGRAHARTRRPAGRVPRAAGRRPRASARLRRRSSAGRMSTTRPPKMTTARSQTSCTSSSSDV